MRMQNSKATLSRDDPVFPRLTKPFLKKFRTVTVTLQFLLSRPRQSITAIICALFVIGFAFLHISLWKFAASQIFAHYTSWGHSDSQDHRNSAFSTGAGKREYGPAWPVINDNGKEAAKKEMVEIAYFIQVGSDSVELLPRLFSRIHDPRNVYVIHIDTKVDVNQRNSIANLINSSELYSRNMHMLQSEMVTYKAISMVLNTLAGMTVALEKHRTWDYFINLSGADYPLVSPESQARILARPRAPIGRLNFVTFFPKKEWVPYSFRVRNMHWDPAAVGFQSNLSRLRLLRAQKENPLEQHRAFVFTKAEAWMILSRPFVQFIVRSGFAKRMLVNHAHVLSVPEHYFTDVLYNHPFWKTTIVPDALRKVVWYLKNRRAGQHPYLLDGGETAYSRWEYIAQTRSLFARKFSSPDSLLMERIDNQMSGYTLNRSDSNYQASKLDRETFLRRIVNHFDLITKKTLDSQKGYSHQRSAYPKFIMR